MAGKRYRVIAANNAYVSCVSDGCSETLVAPPERWNVLLLTSLCACVCVLAYAHLLAPVSGVVIVVCIVLPLCAEEAGVKTGKTSGDDTNTEDVTVEMEPRSWVEHLKTQNALYKSIGDYYLQSASYHKSVLSKTTKRNDGCEICVTLCHDSARKHTDLIRASHLGIIIRPEPRRRFHGY